MKNNRIVKIQPKNCRKYGLIYTTILYDLKNGLDISELYCHQKRILNKILTETNKKLYALICSVYDKSYQKFSEKYKLWKGFIPLEDEEFSPMEHADFKAPIFEQKIEGNCWILWNGIAEINSDFYTDNYMFFNYQTGRFLLIADEEQVEQIKSRLNEFLAEISGINSPFGEYKKCFLAILQDTDCILVEAQDDNHEGVFMFYVNKKSKYNNLLEKVFSNE